VRKCVENPGKCERNALLFGEILCSKYKGRFPPFCRCGGKIPGFSPGVVQMSPEKVMYNGKRGMCPLKFV